MKVVAEEELLRAESRADTQEAELQILDEFAVLCRDLYAFYPMLIRYVDNNRYLLLNLLNDLDFVCLLFYFYYFLKERKIER